MKTSTSLRYLAVVVAILVGAAPASFGQGLDNSEIRGVIRDPSGAVLRNASITLDGDALIGGGRRTLSDDHGAYRIGRLPPGTFTLRADADGFTPMVRERILLGLATTATIDIVMAIASVKETVHVDAHGPVVDVRGSEIVTTLDDRLLQSLPTRRDVADALTLAPGVFNPTPIAGLVVAFGGTIASNGVYADGVDLTEPRRQSPWLPINYNWVQQMQIGALGAGAEYGEFTGTTASALLRSGSNRFSGLADYWTTQWAWIDRNGSSLGGREILTWWDASVQAGGPLRRDKAWLFAGGQLLRREDRPLNYSGEFARSQWAPRGILKATLALPGAARLEGHLQRNRSTIHGANAGPFTAEDALNQVSQSDTSWNARFARPLGERTVFELRHGGYASNRHDDPLPPRTREDPPPDLADGRLLRGNSNVYQDTRPSMFDAEATVTHLVPRLLAGAHDLRAGIDLKWNRSVNAVGFPGGRRLTTNAGQITNVSIWTGDRTEATGRRGALYLQDRWMVSERATLNLGLRADLNSGSVPAGRVLATTAISPRAGLTVALGGSHNSAVKLHYGRYYDALLTERVAFMDIPGIGTTTGYVPDSSGQLIEVFRSAPPGARAIDQNIRLARVDQYVAGFEHRLFSRAVLQAHYVRRNFADFMAMTDTGSQWTPVELQDPGEDGRVGTADDGGMFTAFRQLNPGQQFLLFTNPGDAFRRYDAAQVTVTRRWSGTWQLQASYTHARTNATVGNGDFANAGLNDTGEQSGSRTPGAFLNPNSRINAEGRAVFDKNELKLIGTYRIPKTGGVEVSGILSRLSGSRWERVAIYQNTLVPGNFQTIRLEPRGARQTDPVSNLDIRIEPNLRMPFGPGRLGIAFDVFNVTNQGTPLSVDGASGGNFGKAFTRSDPRTLRIVGRYRW